MCRVGKRCSWYLNHQKEYNAKRRARYAASKKAKAEGITMQEAMIALYGNDDMMPGKTDPKATALAHKKFLSENNVLSLTQDGDKDFAKKIADMTTKEYNSSEEATKEFEKAKQEAASKWPDRYIPPKAGDDASGLVVRPENIGRDWSDAPVVGNGIAPYVDDMGLVNEPSNIENVDHSFAKYYAPRTVSGRIDPDLLNENSWKNFGLKSDEDWNDYLYGSEKSESTYERWSEDEMRGMSLGEKTCCRIFTSPAYQEYADILYGNDVPSSDSFEKFNDSPDAFDTEDEYYVQLLRNVSTRDAVKQITENLDLAMSNAPKKQRVVYRGIGEESKMLLDAGGGSIIGSQIMVNSVRRSRSVLTHLLHHVSLWRVICQVTTAVVCCLRFLLLKVLMSLLCLSTEVSERSFFQGIRHMLLSATRKSSMMRIILSTIRRLFN